MSESYRFGRSGFGGWLLLLVVAQVGQLILSSMAAVSALASSGSLVARGGVLMLLFETVGNAGCAVMAGYVLKLMLNRSPDFPSVMPRVWIATCAFVMFEPGMLALLRGAPVEGAYSLPVLAVCVVDAVCTAAWIGYVHCSERVG